MYTEICMGDSGTEYYLDCEQHFCMNCKSLHKRQKVPRNHKVLNITICSAILDLFRKPIKGSSIILNYDLQLPQKYC
jgi:hypothetical protein